MATLSASILQDITTISAIATPYVTRGVSNMYIQQIIIHNPATTNATVNIYKVLNNLGTVGTASATYLWDTEIILPGATAFLSLDKPGIILGSVNDTLQISSDITTATLQIYGFIEV